MKTVLTVTVSTARKALDFIQDSPFYKKEVEVQATNVFALKDEEIGEEFMEELEALGVEVISYARF